MSPQRLDRVHEPLDIRADFSEEPVGKCLSLTSVTVNEIELVSANRRNGTLVSFVLALLLRKLGGDFIDVEANREHSESAAQAGGKAHPDKDRKEFALRLWEVLRRRDAANARAEWARVLIEQGLLPRIMSARGASQIELIAPPDCICIRRNGREASDALSLRYLYRQLCGLHNVVSDVAVIERCAEILNNRKKTRAAVDMLADARTIEGLSDHDYLTVSTALAKHLSHLGEHDQAIDVMTSTLAELEVAAPGDDARPKFPLPGDAQPGVWYIDPSLVGGGECDSFCVAVLRALYQLGIFSRRKELFARAKLQLDQVLALHQELEGDGRRLLLMTKHQVCNVYEESKYVRHNCKDVFGLVERGIQPSAEDRKELRILEDLAGEWERQVPLDHQRCAFTHRRLGLLWFFFRDTARALDQLDRAIDYFDQAFDLRNFEFTQAVRERVAEWP
jgi:hypothetical protein